MQASIPASFGVMRQEASKEKTPLLLFYLLNQVQLQKKLANYEKIRKFTLLEKPFSIESGELTPSLKIKRKVIEERYMNLIDDMYQAIDI